MALADRMVNGQRRLWMLGLPQGDLHPQTFKLVLDFADALLVKLRKAELKYGYSDGWRADDWMAECQSKLSEHLSKGDPLDVAAYAAFCWHHHWSTALSPQAAGGEDSGQGTSWMDLANGLNGPSPDGRPLYEAFWRRQPGGLTVPWEKQAPAIISMWDGIAADAAVLAAVPPASAPSAVWRPIESAPKGQRFIGWLGNRIGVVEHGLHYVKWPHEVGGPTYRDVWNEVRPGAIQPCEPSHWMPLPAPPFSEAPRPDEMEAEGDSGAIPALPSQKPSSPGSNSNG